MISKRQPDPLASIMAERKRQIEVEGFSAAHDDAHGDGELMAAAQAYYEHGEAINSGTRRAKGDEGDPPADGEEAVKMIPASWPFEPEWFKPGDRRRNLEKAGAFLVAERDRLIRSVDHRIAAAVEAKQSRGAAAPTVDLAPVNNRLQLVIEALVDLNVAERAAQMGASEK